MASSSSVSAVRVGFLGAGKMATALAKGFLKGGVVKRAADIAASCPKQDAHLLEDIKSLGCVTMHSNADLVDAADVVFVATKPNIVPRVLEEVGKRLSGKTLVSVAAGVTLGQLEEMTAEATKVVRLMPNTPCLVGEGASVFAAGRGVTDADADLVRRLASSVGPECHRLSDESLIDAATGVSASGPAYMYLVLESLADGAVKQGLPRALAYRLAAQTMVGAGRMVLETGRHPAELKDEVCSPGGTTIAAMDVLETSGVRAAMMRAVQAAAERCREMK